MSGSERSREDGVEVGDALVFQRRWWRFERAVWIVFVLALVADLAGLFGRGPLAMAQRRAPDGSLRVRYERITRANTPSIMTIEPSEDAVHGGVLRLFVSEEVIKGLGAQRVVPEPLRSTIGDGGVTYTFAATHLPMTVQLELKTTFVGSHPFVVAVPDGARLAARTFVLP